MTRNEAIAAHIAKRIVRNTRKKWASLHADALQETANMSTDLSNNAAPLKAGLNEGAAKRMAEMVNVGRQASSDSINSGLTCGSQVNVGPIRPVDRKTIEGSYPGDSREKESADFSTEQFKNQAGPRGETTKDQSAGA